MQKCLSCSRTDDDIGKCGSPLTCPKQGVTVDPKSDVVIRCDLCDITRAVSVETLTKHRDPRLDNSCQSNICGAYVVRLPTTTPAQVATRETFTPAAELARDEPAPPPAPTKKSATKAKPQDAPPQD